MGGGHVCTRNVLDFHLLPEFVLLMHILASHAHHPPERGRGGSFRHLFLPPLLPFPPLQHLVAGPGPDLRLTPLLHLHLLKAEAGLLTWHVTAVPAQPRRRRRRAAPPHPAAAAPRAEPVPAASSPRASGVIG